MSTPPTRRDVLRVLGVAGLGGVAGCSATNLDGLTPAPSEPRIDVSSVSRRDERLKMAITGVEPGVTVTLTARAEDGGEDPVAWTSENEYVASEAGVVNLAGHAPTDGSYEGVDPMGWLWSMTPTGEDDRFGHPPGTDAYTVTLAAETDGASSSRRVTRRLQADGVTETRVESDVAGYLYEPSGDGPHPGVLVLHGSLGVPLRNTARLLASHGYAALALRWFGSDDVTPTRTWSEVPLSYFDATAAWLRRQNAVRDGPVGVFGVSKGGEAALLLGAQFDWPGVVVGHAPSSLVTYGGYFESSTWSRDGEPLPFVPFPPNGREIAYDDQDRLRTRRVYEAAIENASERRLRDATIEVEQTDAPLLLISGEDDAVWPATPLCERAVARLDEHGAEFPYEHLSYEDAGHGIPVPYKPTTRTTEYDVRGETWVMGGTPAGNAHAAADHWPTVLEYLADGLDES